MKAMSSVSQEIIIEILSWLPVKTLLRFRSVSKTWRTLISEPHFILLHLNHSTQTDKLGIYIKYCQIHFALHSPIDFQSTDNRPVIQLQPPFHDPESMAMIVGSCNGLLCLSTICINTIFNPCTRSYAKLPDTPAQFPREGLPCFPVFGLGYSPHTNEYKLLRIVYFRPPDSTVESVYVDIHTIGTDSWRMIKQSPGDICNRLSGIMVNGYLHWIAARDCNVSETRTMTSRFIVSFDIVKEDFGNFLLPQFDDGSFKYITLGELKGCLCTFRTVQNEHIEVWVMKEYGVTKSWNQLLTISLAAISGSYQGGYLMPFRFLQNGELLLRSNGKLVIYNPRSNISREIVVPGFANYLVVTDYVESLASNNHEEQQRE